MPVNFYLIILLIKTGLEKLANAGVDLVFVLGDPQCYQRSGFQPAINLGFAPPYPLPEKYLNPWMVYALQSDIIGNFQGKIICADTLNQTQYWI